MNKSKLLGGVLLVSGTAIGAGMLALPVIAAPGGFWPALALLGGSWVLMTLCALLLVEASLWLKNDGDMLSIVNATLGKHVGIVAWVCYLLMLYSLTSAYIAGGGDIILKVLNTYTGMELPARAGMVAFVVLFGSFIALKTRILDEINRVFMLILFLAFAFFVFNLIPETNIAHVPPTQWLYTLPTLAVMASAFNFHFIIPSLCHYMEHDAKSLRLTVVLGSTIPLAVYAAWIYLIHSVLGDEGLSFVRSHTGEELTTLAAWLNNTLHTVWIGRTFSLFALVAIATSFLGVSIGLVGFLRDGFGLQQNLKTLPLLLTIALVPPFAFDLFVQDAFFIALRFCGLFVVLLLGVMPAVMVWRGRHLPHRAGSYQAPGGMFSVWFVGLGSVLIMVLVILESLGKLPTL